MTPAIVSSGMPRIRFWTTAGAASNRSLRRYGSRMAAKLVIQNAMERIGRE